MLITVVWSGVVSLIAYKVVDLTMGLRVSEEDEREGLDITSHGEAAYNRSARWPQTSGLFLLALQSQVFCTACP